MIKTETIISRYFKYLDRKGRTFNTILGVVCCFLLGALDILTPTEYGFSFIYLLPISFTTWFAGKNAGFLIATICTAFISRYHFHESVVAAVWNNLSTLGIFFVVTVMLFRIRQLLETESTLSRTDPLTGVMNLRAFSELVEYEVLRLNRENSPFSIAYFDIDNFKMVNDNYGHKKGDELLKSIVMCLTQNLRRTDIVARMGGDEFTIFFPATDQKAVKVVTQKARKELNDLTKSNNWPTTISMGVVTCSNASCDVDAIITTADKLMYDVKNAGKNDVLYAMCPETCS